MRRAWAGLLGAAVALAAAGPAAAAEKVILDSDFNTIGDDGQALVMLAQAMREGKVDLLGITHRQRQRMARAGDGRRVARGRAPGHRRPGRDLSGRPHPLLHDRARSRSSSSCSARAMRAPGKQKEPEGPGDLTAPPDGFAKSAKAQGKSGVDFIIDTVKATRARSRSWRSGR